MLVSLDDVMYSKEYAGTEFSLIVDRNREIYTQPGVQSGRIQRNLFYIPSKMYQVFSKTYIPNKLL
jgi:hypothetical protein